MNICIYKHKPRVDITVRILEAYQRALERIGHKVLVFSHDTGSFSPEQSRQFALEFMHFKADLVLCYGFSAMPRLNGGYFFRKHGIPLVALCFENPFFGLDQNLVDEIKTFQDYYHFFVWDSWYLDLLRKLFKNCHPIRHAAEAPDISNDPLKRSPNFAHELAFIGNIPDFVQMRKERLERHTQFNSLIDRLIQMKMQSPDSNPFTLLSELLACGHASRDRKHSLSLTDPSLHKEIIFPLYAEGLGRSRCTILNQLNGFHVDYFGDFRWQASHITFHPPVGYFDELPQVFRSTIVNLDIPPFQSIDSLNNRFFDAGASGGLLLTKRSRELTSLFPQSESITYGSIEELNEKIRYYIGNIFQRNRTASELFHCVAANHTYDHRAPYLLETVRGGAWN